jgi:wyosine [tRNA(Phe)-imidazoG37] synthetase (radical SAM superfamily)
MTRQPLILLNTADHARDSAGMRYVYPVLSRRAGGISVGINLNPNNACNWRCIYCQVPNLTRGGPPPIDLALLEHELATLLDNIHSGQLIINHQRPDTRLVVDVAFSGNGEPTSAAEFPAAVAIAQKVLAARGLTAGQVKLRLITNGSLLDRRTVQQGIALLGEASGEVWFKLDSASPAGLAQINGARTSPQAIVRRLTRCIALAPTWVQTCFFLLDNQPPAETEIAAYLALLAPVATQLEGVHLYGLARPSLQKEAPRLGRMAASDLESIAQRMRQIGLRVHVSP